MTPRVLLAFAGFVLIGVSSGVAGVLLPAQAADYQVDKATIGLAFITFSSGYLAAAAAAGWIVHRFGMRVALTLGMSVLCASTVSIGARPPFAVLVAVQLVYGFGVGAVDAMFNADLATLPGSATLLNYLHACFGLGALLGPVAAAFLLGHLAWNEVFLTQVALSAPLVLACRWAYPRTTTGVTTSGATGAVSGGGGGPEPVLVERSPLLSAVLRRRAIWLGGFFLCLCVGVEATMGNWGYSFLVEERERDAVSAGWAISGMWMGLTGGRLLLGSLARWLGAARLVSWCLGGIAVALVWIWALPRPLLSGLGLVVLGVSLGPVFPTVIGLVHRLISTELVPTTVGVLVGVSVVGGALMPWLAGLLATRFGLASLLPFTVLLAVLLAVNWWRVMRRLAPDTPDTESSLNVSN